MIRDEFTTHSAEETLQFAEKLGRQAGPGDVFALSGELGTGKTIMAKGIALGLGIDEDITSPTFTLMEIYPGSLPFYHFDLYRIENEDELDNLFFEEYWEDTGVSVIEWAERAGDRLPENTIKISLHYISEVERKIICEYPDDRYSNKL